jgi:hypothetical protein
MLINLIKLFAIAAIVICSSCSRTYTSANKNVPVITPGSNKAITAKPVAATTPASRTMTKRATPVAATHKVIWVNDKVAKKNFDGRLYYDLDGRRYWKNYVDGKYYLYNKAMYSNAAFKPR